MNHMLVWLLTLLFSLSSPAVEGNAAFWRSSLAAGTGPETFEILDGVGPMAEANRYQFSSKETEALSGLSYYGFRFYDPGLQRWINPDPLGEAGGLNLYGFVGNNPLSQVDPYGLLGWSDFNPGLILDEDVHQGLLSLLQGSGTGVPLDPNSNRALLNDEGITPGRLVDEEGNSYNGGQLVGVAAGAVSAIVLAEVVDQFSPLDEVGGLIKGGKKVCKKAAKTIDPSKVRFSQSSIKSTFKDGGSLDDLVAGLKNGSVKPGDVPPIRLVERDGQLFTLDNRRLEVFRQAGVEIPYRMATPEEIAAEGWKFTTQNGGTSIRVRGQ